MTPEIWNRIRAAYEDRMPVIMDRHRQGVRLDPYFIDWVTLFTPIEFNAWQDIRCIGLPLYPQMPVQNKFIDFADPYLKIGVELDGKQWHDVERDRRRDTQLWADGWRIFRVTGKESYQEDELFRALKDFYYSKKRYNDLSEQEWILARHTLIDFPLTIEGIH